MSHELKSRDIHLGRKSRAPSRAMSELLIYKKAWKARKQTSRPPWMRKKKKWLLAS